MSEKLGTLQKVALKYQSFRIVRRLEYLRSQAETQTYCVIRASDMSADWRATEFSAIEGHAAGVHFKDDLEGIMRFFAQILSWRLFTHERACKVQASYGSEWVFEKTVT